MSATLLERIIIEPNQPATASVIWLHGLGASGHDFTDAIPFLGLAEQHAYRFIFPHAPQRPITINGGMEMRAWYDISEMRLGARQDKLGVETSAQMIFQLIENEKKLGIPADKIILVGFSQGAAMALYCGLKYPERLAGVAALSGYIVLKEILQEDKNLSSADLPIFIAHGMMDPIVPFQLGEEAKSWLEARGYHPAFHHYPMMHMVCIDEFLALGKWLQSL